jgi:hypothetical protein
MEGRQALETVRIGSRYSLCNRSISRYIHIGLIYRQLIVITLYRHTAMNTLCGGADFSSRFIKFYCSPSALLIFILHFLFVFFVFSHEILLLRETIMRRRINAHALSNSYKSVWYECHSHHLTRLIEDCGRSWIV